jgi:ABC-type proline/glycine betaine transport system ATPase subunit
MGKRKTADSTVEYGVQAISSKTVVFVTEDLAEAEHTLDLIGEARVVQRTVRYSPWVTVPVDGCVAE